MARSKFKKMRQNIIMIVLLLLGVGIVAYPHIANWWHANRHEAMPQEYNEMIAIMYEEELEY